MTKRLPPHDMNAELAVLGAVIMDTDNAMEKTSDRGCNTSWFFSTDHQRVWESLSYMYSAGIPIDIITASDELRKRQKNFNEAILHDASDKCSSAFFIDRYLSVLQDKWQLRHVARICKEHILMVADGHSSGNEILSSLDFETTFARDTEDTGANPISIVDKSIQIMIDAREKGRVTIPSRWGPLQRLTGGYRRGKPHMVGARPGHGKSTFATCEMKFQASSGFKVGAISIEMKEEELWEKIISDESGLNLHRLHTGMSTDVELAMFKDTGMEVAKLPIYINDRISDVRAICSWIHRMVAQKELDIIYIDFVQRIRAPYFKGKRNEVVAEISHELTECIKQTDAALVILSQLTRAQEPPPNMKKADLWRTLPKLSNLKESGALEEDAYQALLIHPHPIDGANNGLITQPYLFMLEKNRWGPTGRVDMMFLKDQSRFETRLAKQTAPMGG